MELSPMTRSRMSSPSMSSTDVKGYEFTLVQRSLYVQRISCACAEGAAESTSTAASTPDHHPLHGLLGWISSSRMRLVLGPAAPGTYHCAWNTTPISAGSLGIRTCEVATPTPGL